MSKNEISSNFIDHYIEPKKGKRSPLKSLQSSKKIGKSLDDFYLEIQAKRNNHTVDNIYNGKNASQIEMIMIQNRRLIEANHTKR